jgi:hypothetical protein
MAVMTLGHGVFQAVNVTHRKKYGKPSETLQNDEIPKFATTPHGTGSRTQFD